MENSKISNNNIDLIHDATELRKLIAENPDLPIVVLAGEEANNGGNYYWMYCSSVSASIEEILYIHTPYDEDAIFTDKDYFEEAVCDALNNKETSELSEDEFDSLVKAEIAKYEPYWRKVIAVYANN